VQVKYTSVITSAGLMTECKLFTVHIAISAFEGNDLSPIRR
jgi:hypothetical protein